MSKIISDASVKRSRNRYHRQPFVAHRERLPILGRDMDVACRLVCGGVGGRKQRRARARPAVRVAAGGERAALGVQDRAPTEVRRHLGQTGDGGLGCLPARDVLGFDAGHSANI